MPLVDPTDSVVLVRGQLSITNVAGGKASTTVSCTPSASASGEDAASTHTISGLGWVQLSATTRGATPSFAVRYAAIVDQGGPGWCASTTSSSSSPGTKADADQLVGLGLRVPAGGVPVQFLKDPLPSVGEDGASSFTTGVAHPLSEEIAGLLLHASAQGVEGAEAGLELQVGSPAYDATKDAHTVIGVVEVPLRELVLPTAPWYGVGRLPATEWGTAGADAVDGLVFLEHRHDSKTVRWVSMTKLVEGVQCSHLLQALPLFRSNVHLVSPTPARREATVRAIQQNNVPL
jgi:hypothetical protein